MTQDIITVLTALCIYDLIKIFAISVRYLIEAFKVEYKKRANKFK